MVNPDFLLKDLLSKIDKAKELVVSAESTLHAVQLMFQSQGLEGSFLISMEEHPHIFQSYWEYFIGVNHGLN